MSWFREQLSEQVNFLMEKYCDEETLDSNFDVYFNRPRGFKITTLKTLRRGDTIRPGKFEFFVACLPLSNLERAELRIAWGERLIEAKTYVGSNRERFFFDNRTPTTDDEERRESYGRRKGCLYRDLFDSCRRRGGGLVIKSPQEDLTDWFKAVRSGRSPETCCDLLRDQKLCDVSASTLRSFETTGILRPDLFHALCQFAAMTEEETRHIRALYIQVAVGHVILDLKPSDVVRFKIAQYPRVYDWLIAGHRRTQP